MNIFHNFRLEIWTQLLEKKNHLIQGLKLILLKSSLLGKFITFC